MTRTIPRTVDRAALRAALESIGISTTDLRQVVIDTASGDQEIRVTRLHRDENGLPRFLRPSESDELVTVTEKAAIVPLWLHRDLEG